MRDHVFHDLRSQEKYMATEKKEWISFITTAPALKAVFKASRAAIITAAVCSLLLNLLMLVPTIYMLQVYDCVLSTGSLPTLMMLTLITVFLFSVYGGLEWLRAQVLVISSMRFDAMLSTKIHDAIFSRAITSGGRRANTQPLDDLDKLRQFVTGAGLFALLDAPWMPIYIAVMYLFHPWMGSMAIVCMVVLTALAIWNEFATRELLQDANRFNLTANFQTASHLRNAEVITSMGMLERLRARWMDDRSAALTAQHEASGRAGFIAALSKTFRLTSQSLVLGLGAYLAIQREISPGMVIAGSILLGRALAPIDQLIANWRGLSAARSSYSRLSELLITHEESQHAMSLPEVVGEYKLDKIVVTPDGARGPIIKELSMRIQSGTQIAVIGPSAAGKSTLVRTLLGLHTPVSGSVRLDGAELNQYQRNTLGDAIGYLPQDIELLDGTIAENIARFGFIDSEAVVKAARRAGVHEMILALPNGYESKLEGHFTLSAGQRQRVALARALYGDPKVIILDEPNSNLDEAGNVALQKALTELRQIGSTVIIVTHKNNILEQMDRILVMVDGKLSLYGTRDQVALALSQKNSGAGVHPIRGNEVFA
jgi:ATP-binding cassette subfamily C protein EexD